MKKSAYLIIAHDNFRVLESLIEALDDSRNDIYVHIDKKVTIIPELRCDHAQLRILTNRIDVRWGSYSQIACEYLLFEAVLDADQPYQRVNLISGTHFPLRSQDEIFDFYDTVGDKQLLSYLYTNSYEINFKLGYYHFFLNNFRFGSSWKRTLSQKLWQASLKLQKIFNIRRKLLPVTIKANNWVSITQDAMEYIVSQKSHIEERFKNTFCGDEYFIPYLLENNKDFIIQEEPLLLYNDFEGGSNPKELTQDDFSTLIDSGCLFGRKFSDRNSDLIHDIISIINKR